MSKLLDPSYCAKSFELDADKLFSNGATKSRNSIRNKLSGRYPAVDVFEGERSFPVIADIPELTAGFFYSQHQY